jgi:hypothetical protein
LSPWLTEDEIVRASMKNMCIPYHLKEYKDTNRKLSIKGRTKPFDGDHHNEPEFTAESA